LTINNSTIDAAQPGISDVGDGAHALELSSSSPADVDARVDSSILVEDVNVLDGFDGTGTLSCDYTDLPAANVPAPWTDDCPLGGGSTNTSTPPGNLFVGGDPFDWSLKAGAPAIDTGTPGPPPPGFAVQDLAGNPRRAAGTNATCPDGVRDKGAYEFIGPPCVTQPPTIIGGENPPPGTQLSSTRGTWTDSPTGYSRQWLHCDAGGSDCSEVTDRTGQSYTVGPTSTTR
jgi:hypothetical protein